MMRYYICLLAILICVSFSFAGLSYLGKRLEAEPFHMDAGTDSKMSSMRAAYTNCCHLWMPFSTDLGSSFIDISEFRNDGANLFGTEPTWTSEAGGCLDFDGINNRFGIGENQRHFDVSNAFSISVSVWVKPMTSLDGALRLIVNKRHQVGAYYPGWHLGTYSDGTVWWYLSDIAGGVRSVHSSTILATNTWYHIVGSYGWVAGTAYFTDIYVNGILEDTTNTVLALNHITNSQPAFVGGAPDPLGWTNFNGRIDDVRVWISQYTASGFEARFTSNQVWEMYQETLH